MRQKIAIGLKIVVAVALAGLVLGLGAGLHPIGDSFAVFRGYVAVMLVAGGLGLVVSGPRVAGMPAALLGAAVFLTLDFLRLPGQAGARQDALPYTLYQKNILASNPTPGALLDDILARDPDVVTLQEVHPRQGAIVEGLRQVYPAGIDCSFITGGKVSVYARWPLIEGTSACDWGMARMQVRAPDGPLWVIGLHLHWVYPYENAVQVAELVPVLEGLAGPKVLGGDFNNTPWSRGLGDIARAGGMERLGPTRISLVKLAGTLRVPIDHVLVTGGEGSVRRLPLLGSDHRGIWARFALPEG